MEKGNVNYNEVRKRLSGIIQELKMTQRAFANMVGIDPSNFLKKVKGDLPLTRNDFRKLADAKISVDYLMYGKEPRFTGSVNTDINLTVKDTAVPVYEEEFGCGFTEFDNAAIRPIGYTEMPGTRGATCWCKATGDSMWPLINNGDYVCLKKVEDWNSFVVYGDIYAIDTFNDMRTIKRIERGESDDEYMLVPHNKEHKPQPIKKAAIRSMFRVVAVTKML